MRNYLIASTLATVIAAAPAMAADGVINFTGKVLNSSCAVDPTLDVKMGDVTASAFSEVGAESTKQAFKLTLKNCPVNLSTAQIKFEGANAGDSKELFKLNDGGAEGLGLRISNEKNAPIVPGGVSVVPLEGKTTYELPYYASYQSTGPVTMGDANASVQFSVSYN
ncbi:type 1 fimbrial protein [Serratia nevei]|uniref:fimbrial protein n=1 Tax=Serratia nevei TaxID=2703794 RepID=UPI00209ECDCF|nr:fimbrial protein [Serratia nevei]MCP1107080.1 type 1 fimbrial protein [Serratia nevei]